MAISAKKSDFTLAVLGGGRSQRLGTDKGLFCPLADEPLVVRSFLLLAKDFQEILIVVKDAEQAGLYTQALATHLHSDLRAKMRIVHDALVGAAAARDCAMSGVLTAVTLARCENIVTVPVDQVGVRAVHLRRLQDTEGAAAAAFYDDDRDDYLPFPALWQKASGERLLAFSTAGLVSVKNVLRELNARRVALAAGWHEEISANTNDQAAMAAYFGAPLFDRFSRRMHYLRFSLTESCNLSCQYCLPEGFPEWYRHKARLGLEQIKTILAGFRRLGFRKVRFTGGEPTVHRDCLAAVAHARQIGFEEIAMTTNGLLLENPQHWQDAGLTAINVSLDTLRRDTFQRLCKSSQIEKVLTTIDRALATDLEVKINTVLLRSVNGGEIAELIDWARARPLTLRFIELMPTKLNQSFQDNERVLGSEIEPLLRERGFRQGLQPHEGMGKNTRGPATLFAAADHPGRIGLINPLSCNFCNACNRLRVTAQGKVKLCLFGDNDIALNLSSPELLALQMRSIITQKAERHHLEAGELGNVSTFRTIGG